MSSSFCTDFRRFGTHGDTRCSLLPMPDSEQSLSTSEDMDSPIPPPTSRRLLSVTSSAMFLGFLTLSTSPRCLLLGRYWSMARLLLRFETSREGIGSTISASSSCYEVAKLHPRRRVYFTMAGTWAS